MIRILVNDGIHPKGQYLLEQAGFEVDTTSIPQEELADKLNAYDAILVRSATKVRKELIDAAPNLKLIGRGGVGLDNIDVEYARERGIEVINTPAASSNSVAELVFAHLLSSIRFLNKTNRQMADTEFGRFKELKKESSKGQELFGKTLGVIGFGRIGRETARIAIGAGMNVVAHDPYLESADVELKFHPAFNMASVKVPVPMISKEELLAQSDFISLHIPGGGEAVIGEREIGLMKKGAVLVNCARGGVVDEKAMSHALAEGHLSAVGLDVFETEPPVNMDFFTRDDVSLSPHIGAATSEAQERIGEELAQKITAFFN
ncbi:MAG: D-2-hydroxyacid dehydrogenase [Bacteroidia bacterium]|nr:D-2-hydroxyacid dehydrogenase [Bacteroidia bacterium]